MTDRPLDSTRDRLVSALLGELSPAEMTALDEAIANDDELRRDWHELQSARAAAQAAMPAAADDFAFTWPSAAAVPEPPGFQWRPLLAAAAGFLMAALLFSTLMVLGLRIDRGAGSLTIAFGHSAPTSIPDDDRVSEEELVQAALLTAADHGVSRAELASGLQAVLDVTGARFDDLERRQTENQASVSRALYDAISLNQQRQLDVISAQLQFVAQDGGGLPRPFRAQPSGGPVNHLDRQGDFQ